jgi:lipoprotein signal peptidase
VGVVALDQVSKAWILRTLGPNDGTSIPLIGSWLSLTFVKNNGVAFGMFQGIPHFFTLTSIVISIGALLFYRYQLPNNRPWIQVSVGMIVGGAIGNIIDRIRYSYVVDFVHVSWFPGIFNLADSAIVTGSAGILLARFRLPGLNLFVASSTAVFDSSAEHQRNLDVRESFSGLVPLLFFLRHCRISLPQNLFPWANWIIDDPNLTPRYGFLDIRELAECVREIGAAASIAFIPWNHRRTAEEVVGLFKQSWPQLSICVHGCDHTGSEFSTTTVSAAMPLVDLAYRRMAQLERETSLGFDRVMVFPQGRFSGEAMRALRASPMFSAVNTELVDCQTGAGVKGHELLRPAIMSFGGFPLFMRRRAEEASANFALDLLLGKPCLIVTHHQFFEDGLKPLRAAVDRLNALQPDMAWTNLERGILSTYSVCSSSNGGQAVRLYSARTTVQPQTDETISFRRLETDPEVVEVFVNGTQLPCSRLAGGIQFTVKGPGKETMTVEARSSIREPRVQAIQSRKHRLKVSARRYLSEVRDNYLCRFPRLNERAASVQQLLHRVR